MTKITFLGFVCLILLGLSYTKDDSYSEIENKILIKTSREIQYDEKHRIGEKD